MTLTADDSQEMKLILQKLEQMDRERRESPIPGQLTELSTDVRMIRMEIHQVKERSDESHTVLLGNGDPEKGLQNKFTKLALDVAFLKTKIQEITDDGKDVRDKAWDVIKPIIIMIVTWIFMAGIFYAVLAPKISDMIQHIQP